MGLFAEAAMRAGYGATNKKICMEMPIKRRQSPKDLRNAALWLNPKLRQALLVTLRGSFNNWSLAR